MEKLSVTERFKRAAARLNQGGGGGGFNKNEKIFFDLKEGEHHIRLVSQWVEIHRHQIGGPFMDEKLYPDSAFEGDNKLKKQVTCIDFDPTTEICSAHPKCALCYLNSAANDILNSPAATDPSSGISANDVEFLKRVRKASRAKSHYYFLCLDRDNPEIAPGQKGIKIIEFPYKLWEQYGALTEANEDLDFAGEKEAPELFITVKGKGKDAIYSINLIMRKGHAELTDLTDEEKALKRPDILKIFGKAPSQKDLFERLNPEIGGIIDDYVPPAEAEDKEAPPAEEASAKSRFSAAKRTAPPPQNDDDESTPF